MINETIFDCYVKRLSEVVEQHQTAILDGSYKTFESYKEACGFYRGIQKAYLILMDLDKEINKENQY